MTQRFYRRVREPANYSIVPLDRARFKALAGEVARANRRPLR